jgi:hypothetical protein
MRYSTNIRQENSDITLYNVRTTNKHLEELSAYMVLVSK